MPTVAMIVHSGSRFTTFSQTSAEHIGWLRVVDESGEVDLYSGSFFQVIDVPLAVEESVLLAS